MRSRDQQSRQQPSRLVPEPGGPGDCYGSRVLVAKVNETLSHFVAILAKQKPGSLHRNNRYVVPHKNIIPGPQPPPPPPPPHTHRQRGLVEGSGPGIVCNTFAFSLAIACFAPSRIYFQLEAGWETARKSTVCGLIYVCCSDVTRYPTCVNNMPKRWNSTAIARTRKRLKPGPFSSFASTGLGTRLERSIIHFQKIPMIWRRYIWFIWVKEFLTYLKILESTLKGQMQFSK